MCKGKKNANSVPVPNLGSSNPAEGGFDGCNVKMQIKCKEIEMIRPPLVSDRRLCLLSKGFQNGTLAAP